jgi:hypothetical protein
MESAEPVSRGSLLVRLDVACTAIVVVAGVLGAVSDSLAKVVLTPVSAAAGAVGILAFIWSYFHAIGRSREHEISVSQLYAVAGSVAPKRVKRPLQWSLWVQVGLAIAVMAYGFSRTKPQEFNWAAVIIVVPLFGMGVNGVWVSRYGTFGPRILTARPSRKLRAGRPSPLKKVSESRDAAPYMQQNEPHGCSRLAKRHHRRYPGAMLRRGLRLRALPTVGARRKRGCCACS